MAVTIHWAADRPALVRALAALGDGPVRATGTGVVVTDEVAYRWLNAQRGSPVVAPETPQRVVVDDVVVEMWPPPPSPPPTGRDTAGGLNGTQRAALEAIRSGDPDAKIHPMTVAALRRRGLVPPEPSGPEEQQP